MTAASAIVLTYWAFIKSYKKKKASKGKSKTASWMDRVTITPAVSEKGGAVSLQMRF